MRSKSAALFLATCAVTAVGWVMFWPDQQRPPEVSTPPPPVPATPAAKPWQREELTSIIASLETPGKSGNELLKAAKRIDEVPAEEFPSILESIECIRNHSLTRPAKALLIRWASQDPDAAIAWAWPKFRSESAWQTAFGEICATWAWKDPQGLRDWTLARLEAQPMTKERPFGDLSAEEAKAIDAPALKFGDIAKIAGWLMKEDPRLGMEIFLKRGGFSSDDTQLADGFTDPRKIEQAMLAFPPEMIEPLKKRHESGSFTVGPDMHAQTLLLQWRKLDPDDFKNSAYASYLPQNPYQTAKDVARSLQTLTPGQRETTARESLTSIRENYRASVASAIAEEWVKLDPAACREWLEGLPEKDSSMAAGDYAASQASSDLEGTLDWIERFGPEARGSSFVHALDAWTKANPQGIPEMSGWSESRKSAWLDLSSCENILRR